MVLIGGGHTHACVVKRWANQPIDDCEQVCINDFATATYSGILPGTLGGQFDEGKMHIDLKALLNRDHGKLIVAETWGLDLQRREVLFTDREPLSFDSLSMGVGSKPAGWQKVAASPLVVQVKPMQKSLSRLHTRLEKVSKRMESGNIAIVGGGVASVEIAFGLQKALQQRGDTDRWTIEIFTASPHVAQDSQCRRWACFTRATELDRERPLVSMAEDMDRQMLCPRIPLGSSRCSNSPRP